MPSPQGRRKRLVCRHCAFAGTALRAAVCGCRSRVSRIVLGASIVAPASVRDDRGNRDCRQPHRRRGYDALASEAGPGSAYDAAKADQSIKALFATGLFANVGIERRGATLVVKVVENPLVSRVYVEGSTLTDKTKLDEQIQLKPRARYTDAKGHADSLRLRDHYRRLGRLATTVEPSVIYQSDGRVEVTYVVKEGTVTKVDAIAFVGNRAFTAGQLRSVISTSQSGWLDILKSAAFYDPERINQDKELLRRHYLKQGFPDARVLSAEAVKNPQGTGYVITFTVEEGERFTFAPASVETSLRGADTDKLQDLMAVKPGSAYNQGASTKSVEKMTLTLSDAGPGLRPREGCAQA